MPTAGPFLGRFAEIATSPDPEDAYVDVERCNSPKFSGTNDTTETSSNDSNGHKERMYTWTDGSMSFEMIADEAATGQEALWTAFFARTKRWFRYRPRGNNTGDREIKFRGLITSIEQSSDMAGRSTYNVTVQKDGAPSRGTQA